jgi:hypothetical protein
MLAFFKKIKNRLDAVINQTSCLFFFPQRASNYA